MLVPPSYATGKPDRRKLNGVRLLQQFGPMESEEYAAVLFHNRIRGLSEKWNRIQDTHKVALPPLLDPHSGRVLLPPAPRIPIWRWRIARLPLLPPVPS